MKIANQHINNQHHMTIASNKDIKSLSGASMEYDLSTNTYKSTNADTRQSGGLQIQRWSGGSYKGDCFTTVGSGYINQDLVIGQKYTITCYYTDTTCDRIRVKTNGQTQDITFAWCYNTKPNTYYTIHFTVINNNRITKGGTELKDFKIEEGVIAMPFKYKIANELPSQYIAVEYLESDGYQFIDTGFYTKSTTAIKATILFTERFDHNFLFGGWSRLALGICNSGTDLAISNYNTINLNSSIELNQKYNVILDPQQGYLQNGVSYYTSQGNNASGARTIMLFGSTDNGAGTGLEPYKWGPKWGCGRIYKFQLYEDNQLKLNLIPSIRKTDKKPGMYDTISKQFFVNKGPNNDFVYGKILH